MPSVETERVMYMACPLDQVICQIQFPAILSISENAPSAFMAAVQDQFPLYECITAQEQNFELNADDTGITGFNYSPKQVFNHAFKSEDGHWQINLTENFIAFTATAYTRWEDFKVRFELPLSEFMRIYTPSVFTRVGLRYIDVINREMLGISDRPWSKLLKADVSGLLSSDNYPEQQVSTMVQQVEIKLDDAKSMIVRSGYGIMEGELSDTFVVDADTFCFDDVAANDDVVQLLDSLHVHASSFFRKSITGELHKAMNPQPLEENYE